MVELVPDKKKFIVRRICVCKGIEEEENTHALHRKRTKMNTKTQGSEGYHCYTRGSKKEQQDITRARWEGRGRKKKIALRLITYLVVSYLQANKKKPGTDGS